jgi:hypothetical protein
MNHLMRQPEGFSKFIPKSVSHGQQSTPKTKIAELFDKNVFPKMKESIGKVSKEQEESEKYRIKDSDRTMMAASEKYCREADRGAIDDSLRKFSDSLKGMHEVFGAAGEQGQIRYAETLQRHVNGVLKNPGTISHDLDIVFRESLRFLSTKAVKHGDDPRQAELGKRIITELYENFPDYINNSHTYREIFSPKLEHGTVSSGIHVNKSNRDLAEIAYEKISQRLNDKETRAAGPTVTGRMYKEAAIELIKGEKPKYKVKSQDQYFSYIPMRGRRDMHAHIHQNYDPTKSYLDGIPWAVNMGKATGVSDSSIMSIPHHIVGDKPVSDAPTDYAYYTDNNVKKTVFASFDQSMLKAFNELTHDQQKALTPSETGIEMMADKKAMARLAEAAAAFSHNVTKAKLEAGEKNILVLFGELTTNKPQVPQRMIGSDPRTFVNNSAQLQSALFDAAQKGALSALETLSSAEQEDIKVQIRLVIHTDTEKEGVKLDVAKLGEADETLRGIVQPTVEDLENICDKIDKNLAELKHPRIRHVVQLAHFAGVNTVNWSDRNAERTAKVDHLVNTSRGFENLEVLMDTSWLTASARYINTGMGDFLKKSDDKAIRDVGDRFFIADKIANDGFMFFSAGERHFQERLTAGDNSPEVIDGLALMRESCDRCTESYFRELGGIYADLQNNPDLQGKLQKYIEADIKNGPSEGNFVGMLLKQHEGAHGNQAKTPFVWGADGLTQFAEPSGANKFFMYANQLGPVETLMEQLGIDGAGKPVGAYHAILKSMKMGDDKEDAYWGNAQSKANISVEGIQPDGPLDPALAVNPDGVGNIAANHLVPSKHAVSLVMLDNENSVLQGKNIKAKL